MTSQTPTISEVLLDPVVADLIAESGPWWLWTADAGHLVATNDAGARAMGVASVSAALARGYDQGHAFAGQIRRLAEHAGAEARPERLRIFGRFGSESALAEVRTIAAGGTRLIAVRIDGASPGDTRAAAIVFTEELAQPALLFDRSGRALAAGSAAASLRDLPLADLIGPEFDRVMADLGSAGRASVALINGTMSLVQASAADAILALLPQASVPEAPGGLRLVASAAREADPDARATHADAIRETAPQAAVPPVSEPVAAPEVESVPAAALADPADAPVRFAWRMDGSLRFHSIDPPAMAAPAGLSFHEAAARFGLDPEGQFARAVEASRPFSGVPAIWPLGSGARRLAVTLAAFPTLREGGLQGYAGFGLVVEEVAQTAAAADPDLPAANAGGGDVAEPSPATASTDRDETVPSDEEAGNAPAAPMTDSDAATDAPGNPDAPAGKDAPADARPVLTLHTNPPNVVALRSTAGQDPRRPGLSPGERNAFREIARALGARTDGDEGAAPDAASGATAFVRDTGTGSDTPAPQAPVPAGTGQTEAGEPAVSDDEAAAVPEPDVTIDTAPADLEPPAAAPPVEQQRSVIPPAFAAMPPIAPAEPAPAIRGFVDSGTPFGPLPSAFGSTPASSVAAAAAPPVAPAAPATDTNADTRALLDRVPAGLVVHRGNQVLFANRTVLDWIGFTDADALEQAGGIARLFAGNGAHGEGGDHVTLTAHDGSPVAVEARLSKTMWAGEPAFLFTLRRQEPSVDAESEAADLAELRGRLDEVEQILDTATDGIVIVNADASIESMNRSAEALFGYESAEVKGRSITTLFAPESHRSALDYCDGLLSNGVASILNDGRQIIGRVKQGGLIPLYMTMGRTGPAARPKLAAVFRDMTQWKKAEEDLLAAKRQAEQASSQKSDFLAKISHEIRTPLNAIIGFSEVMMEERFGPVGNERYRDYLKDIHASGGHVLSLINDLLDLSKIEAGKLELSFTSVDLNDIIQSTVAIMQPQANRERVIIRSSLQPRLPNVVADARSLRQIVLNLLSNSVKFTPAGGQIIVSTALSDAGEAVLRVRDTGVGMTDAELRAAMEPFRQVATSNPRAAKGTGLGLPLTKALVEANRASFGISSTPNQGTLVEVVFPPTRVLAE